ncbi:MAG: hypothetical protein FWC71_01715 [Defluviitaleaceae bacterium]|nr:hypothetical protein [Defluviitaleaceae bacterium]
MKTATWKKRIAFIIALVILTSTLSYFALGEQEDYMPPDVHTPATNGTIGSRTSNGVTLEKWANKSVANVDGIITYTIRAIYNQDDDTPQLHAEKNATPLEFIPGVSNGEITAGHAIHYTITVTNTSDTDTGNFSVSDPIPVFTTFVPGSIDSPPNVIGTYSNNAVTWTVENLGPGETMIFRFSVIVDPTAPAGTIIFNRASVKDSSSEALTTTHVVVRPTIYGVKTAYSAPGVPLPDYAIVPDNNRMFYTITVRNTGNTPSGSVTVRDVLPQWAIPTSITPMASPCFCGSQCVMGFGPMGNRMVIGNEVHWVIPNIPPHGAVTVCFAVQIQPFYDDRPGVEPHVVANHAFVNNLRTNETRHYQRHRGDAIAFTGEIMSTTSDTPLLPNAIITDVIDITLVEFVPGTVRVDGVLTSAYEFNSSTGVLRVRVDLYANIPVYVTFDVIVLEYAAGKTIYNTATIHCEDEAYLTTSNEVAVVVPAPTTSPPTTPAPTTPAETTPVETTPQQTTPAETTPAETTQQQTTPTETTPAETTPQQTTPAETTPAETTQQQTTPTETTPVETTPQQTTPAETTPVETTPQQTTPAETTPIETTPQQTTPAETTPAETTPQQTTPAETTPAETTPQQTTPAETTPAETTPQPTTPAETTPVETTPQQTAPQQTTPQQTTPPQTTPQQTLPPTQPPTDPPTRVVTFPSTTATPTSAPTTTPTTTPNQTSVPTTPPTTTASPLIKFPSVMEVPVGGTVSWTLHGFHNRTGAAVTNFAIVDMPGVGLNFVSGSLPAFNNSAGVTYDIRYMVQGSNTWRTLVSSVDASRPFNFTLPQPGNLHYTEIGLFFGTVPAYFGLGNTITFTFVAGSFAPNNELVNHFIIMHGGNNTPGQSPYRPLLRPPVNGGNTLVPDGSGNGYFELDNQGVPQGQWTWNNDTNQWDFIEINNTPIPIGRMPQTGLSTAALWFAAIVNVVLIGGLGSLIMIKTKNRKRIGGSR